MSKPVWLKASKWHAYGNDFIVFPPETELEAAESAVARAICDPHYGIGADGCVFLKTLSSQRFRFRVFNQDGSQAEMSGNGARCAAAFLHFGCKVEGGEIVFETLAGTRCYRRIESDGLHGKYRSSMGEPDFSAAAIPFSSPDGRPLVRGLEVAVGGEKLCITALSVGNPQCVVFVDALPDLLELQRLGAALGTHPYFPEGTNVSFVQIVGPRMIEIRIWERGVGPTCSSGTGCCGAAVAAIAEGKVGSPLEVSTETGVQTVRWSAGSEIELEGDVGFIADLRYYFPESQVVGDGQ